MARCPFAQWRGEIPNETKGKMYDHKGLVIHIEQGSESGTDQWFHNPQAQASAHFGCAKDGTLQQWVDTDDTAWAEMAGNHYWVSVECEGFSGHPLTQQQEESIAKLFAWLHKEYPHIPLQVTGDPTKPGLGHHSMGGADWGGHYQCPGNPIIDQKPYIVHRAAALADFPAPEPKPEPKPTPKPDAPAWYHRVLSVERTMLHGDDVKHVQEKLRVSPADGWYGENTAAKVRGFQKLHKLTADGRVGPKTAKVIG